MATYKFDESKINGALEAGKKTGELTKASAGEFSLAAGCIEAKVEGNQICVELPLGLGTYCISIPVHIPNGSTLKVCLSVVFNPLPTGIELTVSYDGVVIFRKVFKI